MKTVQAHPYVTLTDKTEISCSDMALDSTASVYGETSNEADDDSIRSRMEIVDSLLGSIEDKVARPDRDRIMRYKDIELTGANGYPLSASKFMTSFISQVYRQLRGNGYHVFSDNVFYEAEIDDMKMVLVPDVSITMLHDSTENQIEEQCALLREIPRLALGFVFGERNRLAEKYEMEVYAKAGVEEYWIVILPERTIEIYSLEYDERLNRKAYACRNVVQDVAELCLVTFPDVIVNGRELFAE